jgi:hypothetical protein
MPTGTRTGRATRTATSGRHAPKSTTRSTRAATPRGGSSNGAEPRRRAQKWVYLFEQGDASMRDLLGGKGAGVAEMTRAGLPVPPGFTITTQACNAFYANGQRFPDGMWEQVLRALKETERKTRKRFGDPANPLLVSVRSGAKFSMPGMMDTVLNLGLNAQTLKGLAALTGDQRFAKDAYRRFIQLFSKIVLGINGDLFEHELDAVKTKVRAKSDADLKPGALDEVIERYRKLVRKHAGIEFPEDPMEQLRAAIGAVFSSWNNKRATDYRNFNKIPHDLGTAVNVQSMVFGNMGDDSGTGVAFTRDPSTGEHVLYGEYLTNAQGEDVVAGIRTPKPISAMAKDLPKAYAQFVRIAKRLERHYRDVQDMEFTIERGRLFMLQTRSGKRTAEAAVKIAVDMVGERLITKQEAVLRVEPTHVDQLLHTRLDPKARVTVLATGLAASPGAAYGKARLLHEHVLGAAQADPLRAELAGKHGVVRVVAVGPHLHAPERVRPAQQLLQLPGDLRVDHGDLSGDHPPGAAVDGEVLTLLDGGAPGGELPLGEVDPHRLGAGDTRLAHAPRHHRGVRRAAPSRREHSLRCDHPVDVVGVGLDAHQDDLLAFGRKGFRAVRVEHRLPVRRTW